MNAVTVATYNRLEDAELLKHRLESAGIHSLVHDESKLQRFWFLAEADAAMKVQVDYDDFETAKTLLKEWDRTEHVLDCAVRCPQCGSSRIEYPQYTRKFITPILIEVFVSLGLFPKEFYCQDCQFTWPKKEEVPVETDVLGWPTGRSPDESIKSSPQTQTKTSGSLPSG